MKFELSLFENNGKAGSERVAPAAGLSCKHKRLTENAYLVVLFVLVGLILHSQMIVYAAAQLGSVDSTWSRLDEKHCPWNWSWLVAELHVEAAVWQQRLHTCVSQNRNGPLCTILTRGEGDGTLGSVYFLISSFECDWFKLVWPNWSSEAKRFLVLDTEAHTHTVLWPLTPSDPVLWIWSAGYKSTFLCGVFLNILLWPEHRKSVL